jgi:hypothetical protein
MNFQVPVLSSIEMIIVFLSFNLFTGFFYIKESLYS